MKRKRLIMLFVLAATVGPFAWLLVAPTAFGPKNQQESVASSTEMNPATPAPPTRMDPFRKHEERKAVLAQIQSAFKAPIAFYGRGTIGVRL